MNYEIFIDKIRYLSLLRLNVARIIKTKLITASTKYSKDGEGIGRSISHSGVCNVLIVSPGIILIIF